MHDPLRPPLPGLGAITPKTTRARPLVRLLPPYLLAVVLPVVSSTLTVRYPVLQTIPFALYFISITVVASIGGFAPSVTAVAASFVTRNLFFNPGQSFFHLSRYDSIRLPSCCWPPPSSALSRSAAAKPPSSSPTRLRCFRTAPMR